MIATTLYSDPACPWAYSESPALRVIEWRYRRQLDWRLVLIGLTEDASQYEARGYTPLRGALGQLCFRGATGCRSRPSPRPGQRHRPGLPRGRRGPADRPRQRVGGVPGAPAGQLQRRRCCSTTTRSSREALRRVAGSTPTRWSARSTRPRCVEAYQRDRAETRERRPARPPSSRARPRLSDGPVRFTAPSVVLRVRRHAAGGRRLSARRGLRRAGRQPRPDARPRAAARDPGAAARATSRDGLTTQEVARAAHPEQRRRRTAPPPRRRCSSWSPPGRRVRRAARRRRAVDVTRRAGANGRASSAASGSVSRP